MRIIKKEKVDTICWRGIPIIGALAFSVQSCFLRI